MPITDFDRLRGVFGSHKAVAQALGVTRQTYLRLRSGQVQLRAGQAILLAYFNRDPEQFLEVARAVLDGREVAWDDERAARLLAERLTTSRTKPAEG